MPSMKGVSGQSFSGNRCKIFPLRLPDPKIITVNANRPRNFCIKKESGTYALSHDRNQQLQNNQPNETLST